MSKNTKKALGIDVGNVIINNRFNDLKSLDAAGYQALPMQEGAFAGLKILNDYFKGEVYLISKCTEWAGEQSLAWFKNHNFYEATGIKPEKIYLVRERKDKDGVCQKLGITHFIDDRLEVLSYMIESVPNLYLFEPYQEEVEKYKEFLPKVTLVLGWEDMIKKVK